jgi:hypothetical protein
MQESGDTAFGGAVQWDEMHERTVDGLVSVGNACGDEEALMRAKAGRVCQLLREALEELPSLQISVNLPPEFTDEQLEIVSVAVNKAATAGMQVAMGHAVEAFAGAMYDLCTSKLRHPLN